MEVRQCHRKQKLRKKVGAAAARDFVAKPYVSV